MFILGGWDQFFPIFFGVFYVRNPLFECLNHLPSIWNNTRTVEQFGEGRKEEENERNQEKEENGKRNRNENQKAISKKEEKRNKTKRKKEMSKKARELRDRKIVKHTECICLAYISRFFFKNLIFWSNFEFKKNNFFENNMFHCEIDLF